MISTDSLDVGGDFRDALTTHLHAIRRRDLARFAATLDDDVVNVGPRGERIVGKGAVTDAHAAWFASTDAWTFDYAVLHLRAGETSGLALLHVRYRERIESPEIAFVLSLLFERHASGAWLLVFDQNTPAS